jgi:hypothetical protein
MFHDIPECDPLQLRVPPSLASWMAGDHPDQVRLSSFLDHAEARVRPRMDSLDGPLALRLDVGLPASTNPLVHHDLDNYLYPLARKLGANRFASVWGTKAARSDSWIRVDHAEASSDFPPADVHHVRTTRSADSRAWQLEIQEQIAEASQLPAGPVDLQMLFRVDPGRNWANLWKRAIDALDPILGREQPDREWCPQDGRIVRLGLNRELDPALRHDVEIAICARTTFE